MPLWIGLAVGGLGRRGSLPVGEGGAARAAGDAPTRLTLLCGVVTVTFLMRRNQWSYSRHRCLHRTHHTGGSAVGRRSPHPKRAATHEPPCDLLRGWTRSRQSNSGGRPVGCPRRRRPTRSSRRCSTRRRARPTTARCVRGGSSFSKVRPRRSSARCSPAAYTERCRAEGAEVVPAKLEKERTKLGRAPMVVIVAALPVSGSIPTIEQVSATAAATQNLLLAATALGLGSMWRTGDPCYDPIVKTALDLPGGSVADRLRVPRHGARRLARRGTPRADPQRTTSAISPQVRDLVEACAAPGPRARSRCG